MNVQIDYLTMDSVAVISTLRQIAQPKPTNYSQEDGLEFNSDADPALDAIAALEARGWLAAAQCASAARLPGGGFNDMVVKTYHSSAFERLHGDWRDFSTGYAIAQVLPPLPPVPPVPQVDWHAEADHQTAAYELITADSAPPAPDNTIAWVHYIAANLKNDNCEPFCTAVRSSYIPAEVGFVLATGVAAGIAAADTVIVIRRQYGSDRADTGVDPSTRVMLETMAAAVADAADAQLIVGELSLPPVIV
jgi:hypothetical protein